MNEAPRLNESCRWYLQNASDGIHILDIEGNLVEASDSFFQMLGYTREEMLGMNVAQWDAKNSPENLSSDIAKLFGIPEKHSFETQHRRKDGTIFDVEVTGWPTTLNGTTVLYQASRDITERKRTLAALAESEARFRGIFEGNGSVMLLVDPASGEIVDANPAASAYYGYPHEQLLAMSINQINILPPKAVALERARAAREERTLFNFRHLLSSGEIRDVDVYASPVKWGGRALLYSIIHDVTERARAEETLRESLETLQEAQIIGSLGSYSLNMSTQLWTSSEEMDEIFGIGKEYIRSVAGWMALIHPDDFEEMATYFAQEVVSKGNPFNKVYRIVRQRDGVERWVHGVGRLEFDAQRLPVKMRGVIRDITESKLAEMKLRASEERYRTAFQTSVDSLNINRRDDGTFVDINDGFTRMTGYERQDVIGRTSLELGIGLSSSDREKLAEELRKNSVCRNFEAQFRKKDGTLMWGLMSASMIEVGGVPCLLSATKDITEAKLAAEQLAAVTEAMRTSEERYRTTFEQAPIGIVHTALDGRFLRFNTRFAEIIGYPLEEVRGLTYQMITAPEDIDKTGDALDRATGGAHEKVSLEKHIIRKDRTTVWVRLSISAQCDEHGEILHLITMVEDINARKQAEELLTGALEALRLSEEHYRTIFQMSVDAITISRLSDGRYIEVNNAFLDLIGIEPEEIVGRTSTELGIWADLETRPKILEILSNNKGFHDLKTRFIKKNGQKIWVLISASVIEIGGDSCILSVVRDITEAMTAEVRLTAAAEALRLSEERYRTAFRTGLDSININRLDDGTYVDINDGFTRMAGYELQEVLGRTSVELGIWVDLRDRARLTAELRKNSVCRNLEAQFRRKDGSLLWGLMSASVIEVDGVPCVLSATRDITEAKLAAERLATATEALETSEERYRTVFQTSLDAVAIAQFDDGMYVDVNREFLDTMGYDRDQVIGHTSQELNIWADERDRKSFIELLEKHSQCRNLEARFRKRSGEVFSAIISASVIEVDSVSCIVSHMLDISSAKEAEEKIRNLAFYDSLTHLPNRRLLVDRLQQALAVSIRTGSQQALLYIDLDHFKTLNDTLGHQTGDLLLMEVARRIAGSIQETDSLARLGGDEYAVLLEGLSEIPEDAASQVERIAERVLAAIGEGYLLDGHEYHCGASIGINVFGKDIESQEEMLQRAELAMYQAKTAGRNAMRFFSPALQAAVNARAAMEEDLRKGIKGNQFVLYYQPQVVGSKLIGAEALIRWKHPKRGLLSPYEFIPLAEETGLILPLGDWVLEAACEQLAAWASQKQMAPIVVAVNISARQFRQPEFVDLVLAALARTGANPQVLKLELTESMLVENIEEVIAKMTLLKSHGIGFSLDDFGTGYSSLSYLRRLPLDQLKIDRAFVRDILMDVASGAIAQTLISLGRAMGLSVIAEGVETEEQLKYLTKMGCHTFQGFLFGKPAPLKEFEHMWSRATIATAKLH